VWTSGGLKEELNGSVPETTSRVDQWWIKGEAQRFQGKSGGGVTLKAAGH